MMSTILLRSPSNASMTATMVAQSMSKRNSSVSGSQARHFSIGQRHNSTTTGLARRAERARSSISQQQDNSAAPSVPNKVELETIEEHADRPDSHHSERPRVQSVDLQSNCSSHGDHREHRESKVLVSEHNNQHLRTSFSSSPSSIDPPKKPVHIRRSTMRNKAHAHDSFNLAVLNVRNERMSSGSELNVSSSSLNSSNNNLLESGARNSSDSLVSRKSMLNPSQIISQSLPDIEDQEDDEEEEEEEKQSIAATGAVKPSVELPVVREVNRRATNLVGAVSGVSTVLAHKSDNSLIQPMLNSVQTLAHSGAKSSHPSAVAPLPTLALAPAENHETLQIPRITVVGRYILHQWDVRQVRRNSVHNHAPPSSPPPRLIWTWLFGQSNVVAPVAADEECPNLIPSEDFTDIFYFRRPGLFYRAVELAIMMNSLYMSFWVTNFITIVTDYSTNPVLWNIYM